jgi:hypothetical protein
MGREIRRVPLDWIHPSDEDGKHLPMFDQDYESAKQKWLTGLQSWLDGTHEDYRSDYDYWEWDSGPPDRDYYRPKFESDSIGYQVYETVTEGTPTSPVFETLDAMRTWLLSEGFSEHATDMFLETGWAPSMVFTPDRGMSGIGIHSLDHFEE